MTNPAPKDPLKDLQLKLKLVSNALIEERKKSSSFEKQNNELKSQVAELERILNDKENDIIRLTKENLEIQNAMSLKNSGATDNVSIIGKVFQKNTADPVNEIKIKKLQEEIAQLQEQKEKIATELNDFKVDAENSIKEKTKVIIELTEEKNKFLNEISQKNKVLSENYQRIEIMSKSLADFDSIKEKLNDQLNETTKARDDLSAKLAETEKQLNEKTLLYNQTYEKLKQSTQEGLLLGSKITQYKFDLLQNSTKTVYKFKCEKKAAQGENIKCIIYFGQTEDDEYVMMYKEGKNDERTIRIEDVEYLKIVGDKKTDKQENQVEISILVCFNLI